MSDSGHPRRSHRWGVFFSILGTLALASCEKTKSAASSCEEVVIEEFKFVESSTQQERVGTVSPLQIMEGRGPGDEGVVTITWRASTDNGFSLGVAARFLPPRLLDRSVITVDVTQLGLEPGKANVTTWNGQPETLHQPSGGTVEFNISNEKITGSNKTAEPELNGTFLGPYPGALCFKWQPTTSTWTVDDKFESTFCSRYAAFREVKTALPQCRG